MAATDDLSAELIKFNAFLASEEDQERQARAQKKALRLREDAAAALKKVNGDAKASKEEKEAAEVAWKAAIATEERVKAGGPLVEPGSEPEQAAASDEEPASGDEAPADEAPAEQAPADEAAADEAAADEAAADEAPADEAPAEQAPADEAPADEPPAAHEAPVDEPPIELVDDPHVVTDAERAEPAEPEVVVIGDVEDDDVPPPDQTQYPEAGSDAPAAG